MKYKFVILLMAMFLLAESESFAQSKKSARATVWELLEKNNPDAKNFMTDLYNLPVDIRTGNIEIMLSEPPDFMVYIDDYDTEGILDDIGTAVHESCHAYESMKVFHYIIEGDLAFEFEDNYSVYYLSGDEEYIVKHSPTYPSRDFAKEIPKKNQTLRYGTYINTNMKNLGTQQKGIYGLMDEWTAYYNGFKTIVLNFPEYEKLAYRNAGKYLKYIEHASSHKVAYLEFKYYILHYLYYARSNHIDIYHKIINNQQFLEAYSAVNLAYSEIISDYEDRIMDIRKDVEARGEYFSNDGETIWIGNNGIGTFSEDENALKEAIGGVKYVKISEALSDMLRSSLDLRL